MMGRLQRFARDWQEKPDVIEANGSDLLEDAPGFEKPTGSRLTNYFFRVADGLAIHYQRRVFSSLRALHVMAILMGLVFLVYSEFDGPDYMVLVFLAMFFAGVALYLVGSNHEWHRTLFNGYGLGWRLSDVYGVKEVSHTGSLAGMRAWTLMLPEKELGIVVLSNGSNTAARNAVMQSIKYGYLPAGQRDWVAVYEELAEQDVIGSVAPRHLAFAGNQDETMTSIRLDSGPQAAKLLKDDEVDVVVLTPV